MRTSTVARATTLRAAANTASAAVRVTGRGPLRKGTRGHCRPRSSSRIITREGIHRPVCGAERPREDEISPEEQRPRKLRINPRKLRIRRRALRTSPVRAEMLRRKVPKRTSDVGWRNFEEKTIVRILSLSSLKIVSATSHTCNRHTPECCIPVGKLNGSISERKKVLCK